MRHLWYRVLDERALRAVRAELRRGSLRIFADTVSPGAVRRLAENPLPPDVLTHMPVSLAVEDAAGRNIRARVAELTAILVRRIVGDPADYQWLMPDERPWGAEWLRLYGSVVDAGVSPLAAFLVFCENAYLTGAAPMPVEIDINLGSDPWARAAAEHAGDVLRPEIPVRILCAPERLLRRAVQRIVALVARASVLSLRNALSKDPEVHVAAGSRGVVLVEYHAATMAFSPLGANQDWIEGSGIAPSRIVFYFDRNDSPLNDVARNGLKQRGFGWIDYHIPARHDRRGATTLLRCLVRLLGVLPPIRDHAALRRWIALAQVLPSVTWHRQFLRRTGAIALFQHSEFISSQMALNLACRQEGVAFVWSFSSVLVFLSAWYQHAFADLFLAWGSYDLGHCNAVSFDYRFAVQCGVLGYDGADVEDGLQASNLRAQLKARPRFVVALFDSSHSERSTHHSTERCALFYRTVLAMIRANPDWGCLIKSKGQAYEQLPLQPGLQDVVSALELEGRCRRLPDNTKPSLAAMAADSVACFAVNSAGFLAALGTDRPVLHFDPNHLTMHPIFVAGGEGNVIFRDAAAFAAALQVIAAGDRRYGDLSAWADLFDPFRDGRGRHRSGELIRDYVAARDRGLECYPALAEAVGTYASRHGTSCVTTRQTVHDTNGDKLWKSIRDSHYLDWPADFAYSESNAEIAYRSAGDTQLAKSTAGHSPAQ